MTTVTLRDLRASWTNSARASTVYGAAGSVAVPKVKTGAEYAWLRFLLGSGLEPGATVTSHILYVPLDSAATGTFTARRAAASWTLGKLMWGSGGSGQPGVTGASSSVTVTGAVAGDLLAFDVTSDTQAWLDAGGGSHPGWRITTDSATRVRLAAAPGAYSVLTYTYTPDVPTDLLAGNVASGLPRLTFSAGPHSSLQVQIDPTGVFTSPTFDSGTVDSTGNSFDLDGSAYGGLASGSTQWRVRVFDGEWGPWSAAATLTRDNPPAMTVNVPGAAVYDSLPTFDVDMTGITAVRFEVRTSAGALVYDSKKVATTTGEHTPTAPVFKTGVTYVVTITAWDAVQRVDQDYAQREVVTTVLDYDTATAGPDNLTAYQPDASPLVVLTWMDAAPAAEKFLLTRSDGWQAGPFDAAGLASGAGFAYEDWTCPPNVSVTYTVHPIVDDVTGDGESVTLTTRVDAAYLFDAATGETVALVEAGVSYGRPETASLHYPEGAKYAVRRRSGRRNAEGVVTGVLVDSPYGIAVDDLATIEKWADPDRTAADHNFRVAVGHVNMPVWIGDLGPTSPSTSTDELVVPVSFSYWPRPEDVPA